MNRPRILLVVVVLILIVSGSYYFLRDTQPTPVVVPVASASVLVAPTNPGNIVVYKSPTCGCCADWVDHLEAEGFTVDVHDRNDMNSVKSLLGVPAQLASCHTATVGDYVIEGHVAAAEIKRLLQEQPKAVGLAVPGMPIGSPGMEMDDKRMPYDTLLFDRDKASVFASHGE